MAIHFACPSCRTPYKVSDLTGGRVIHCQACGQRVRVPDATGCPGFMRTVTGKQF